MTAWVVAITEENLSAIASEAGPGFDPNYARSWHADHGEGYFLRDESSALDCQFFEPTILFEMYAFEHGYDDGALFKRVVKL